MNLVSDGIDLKTERTKKIIKISIILAVILFFIVLAIMLYYNYVESQTLKLYIDRERMEIPQNLFSYDQNSGTLYVSIEDLASIAGYEYYRGDYNKLTEEIEKNEQTILRWNDSSADMSRQITVLGERNEETHF